MGLLEIESRVLCGITSYLGALITSIADTIQGSELRALLFSKSKIQWASFSQPKDKIASVQYVFMDGWMDGWVGGWVGGWMDGWMDGCVSVRMYVCLSVCLHVCMAVSMYL